MALSCILSYLVIAAVTGGSGSLWQTMQAVLLAGFFVVTIGHVIVNAIIQPGRRPTLTVLAASVTSWAAGAVTLDAHGPLDRTTFPAPNEWLFILSYVGMAAFLLLDANAENRPTLPVITETIVLCGGATCLASFALILPVVKSTHAVPILVACLYPTITLILSALVMGQTIMHRRALSRKTLILALAFLVLCMAESSLIFMVPESTYNSAWWLNLVYAIGFMLLAEGASRAERNLKAVSRTHASLGSQLAAATAATSILVIHPTDIASWFVVVPATLTLIAVAIRLVQALREAEGANEARWLSMTDELTGLPNRRAIFAEITKAGKQHRPLALLLFDLDGFKEINDSLGHFAGDLVLQIIADRLTSELGDIPIFPGRLGGDEFAIVAYDDHLPSLLQLSECVQETLARPMLVDSVELLVETSLGIATHAYGDCAQSISEREITELLRRADVAMYDAKNTGSGVRVYQHDRDVFTPERLKLTEQLRRGIAEGQLTLWYQPQVHTMTGHPVAVEALVRWQHPDHGLLLPGAFLPSARKSGVMLALTEAVVAMAIDDTTRWRAAGLDLRVSVNCAPPELLGGRLLPGLFQLLESAGLPPDTLQIEVTEDSFLQDPEQAREVLACLRDHHVQVAIDDYGKGFSSLAYIRDLSVQELKIDRAFISSLRTDHRSRVIVESTHAMASAMGMRVLAEGVEDQATVEILAEIGVSLIQGYHIARPMPAYQIEHWFATHQNYSITRHEIGELHA